MTDSRLCYAIADEPVIAPTDLLAVKASQAAVIIECTKCDWKSQPFMFKARTVHLTLRSHFLGHMVDGKIRSWHCKRST